MELTVSELKQALQTLPSQEREEIREWLSEAEKANRKKPKQLKSDIERQKKTDRWLKENRINYMNQWVCLDGDQLIAHGLDGRKVYQDAKDAGIKVPFMHHIVEESDWGGW
ncbi:hypothetical protein BH10ACI1_BH10ACI1_10520 [soil metagenome]